MGDPSEAALVPLRLVLESGDTVEVDGPTVYDPSAQRPATAVVVRLPAHRAAWLGRVLDTYTRICRLVGAELPAAERGPAWALAKASAAAGHVQAPGVELARVTSARRMSAAAMLRAAGDFDDVTMIAVVDAAARWLEEPEGDDYAYNGWTSWPLSGSRRPWTCPFPSCWTHQ